MLNNLLIAIVFDLLAALLIWICTYLAGDIGLLFGTFIVFALLFWGGIFEIIHILEGMR